MICPHIVLGVRADATEAEIRDAYLSLVRKFAPALEPERFEIIQEAYEILRTTKARVENSLFEAGRVESVQEGVQVLERIATFGWTAPGLRALVDAEES